ncbi:MAG: hypothetical protein ACPL7R_02190, partial [Anaerolineae bacterium]
ISVGEILRGFAAQNDSLLDCLGAGCPRKDMRASIHCGEVPGRAAGQGRVSRREIADISCLFCCESDFLDKRPAPCYNDNANVCSALSAEFRLTRQRKTSNK